MFLVVSICWSGVKGVPCDHYTSCIGPHCTAPPQPQHWPLQTWDLTGQGTCLALVPPSNVISQNRPPASDIWWPSLETFSNLFTSGTPSVDIWWLLKHGYHAQMQIPQMSYLFNFLDYIKLGEQKIN